MTDSAPDTHGHQDHERSTVTAARAVRLAEIQARADAATEGPWQVDGPWWHDTRHGNESTALPTPLITEAAERRAVVLGVPPWGTALNQHADLEFVAHSRGDVAWLLGEVRCLTGERDRARDVAVALEQELAQVRQGLERISLGDYDADYNVPEICRAVLLGEDIGEPSLPLPLSGGVS